MHKRAMMGSSGLFAMASLISDPLRLPDIRPGDPLREAPETDKEARKRMAKRYNNGNIYLPHQGKKEQERRAKKLLKLAQKAARK